MCRKYITIFDTHQDVFDAYRELTSSSISMEDWDRNNGRPIMDFEEEYLDFHKTQKCRIGGRVCELCDHFKMESVEYPNCEADCSCKLTPVLQQAIVGADYVEKLNDIADLQLEHIKYNIIKAVRQNYPDRHVLIVEAGAKRSNDRDLVYAEVLVFKYPSWMKPIEGDHRCQCQLKELVDGDDNDIWSWHNNRQRYPSLQMVYSFRHSDGTDLDRLHADIERYELAIMGINDEPDDDVEDGEDDEDESSDGEDDEDESSDDQEYSSEEEEDSSYDRHESTDEEEVD